MKQCNKCDVFKSHSDFDRDKSKRDGYSTVCKACKKDYYTKWKEHNGEYKREQDREYRYRNLEDRKVYEHEYYIKNAERVKDRVREYYQVNSDAVKIYQHNYRTTQPEKRREIEHRRRVRKQGNGGSYTKAEWVALCDRYGYRCLRCGQQKKLTADHVVPISLGGTNGIGNIQPLCYNCNSAKSAKTIDYRGAYNEAS